MTGMLLDHAWATLVPGNFWMTCVGRLVFPVYAFQLTEGFFRSHDRKKYVGRLLTFALISEIPFNYLMAGGWIYPFHQNVMLTFLIALLLMNWMESKRGSLPKFLGVSAVCVVLAFVLGIVTFTDYYQYGIFMVFCTSCCI